MVKEKNKNKICLPPNRFNCYWKFMSKITSTKLKKKNKNLAFSHKSNSLLSKRFHSNFGLKI